MAADTAGVHVISSPKRDPGALQYKEVFRLGNGVAVSYVSGGCEQYSHTFSLEHVKDMPTSKGAALFDWMRQQIALVPLKENDNFHRQDLMDRLDWLQKAAPDNRNWEDWQDMKILTVEKNGNVADTSTALRWIRSHRLDVRIHI